MVYKSSAIAAGGSSGGTGGGSVSDITSSGGTISVTNPTGPTTNVDVASNTPNTLAGYSNSGVFSDVTIGTNLTLVDGVLNATGSGGGAVSSVFGRTGAVSANYGDYSFNLIGGTASVSQGGTGQTNLTTHSVLLGEGIAAVSFATTGNAGRLLIDQGNADPAFQSISGDAVVAATGAITLATVNANTGTFGSSTSIPNFTVNNKGLITAAGGNAVIAPAGTLTGTTLASNITASSLATVGTLASGSLATGFTPVSNALLANSSVTVNGVSGVTGGGVVALGAAITLGMANQAANSLAGYNSSGVFSDVAIGSNLSLVSGVLSGTAAGSSTITINTLQIDQTPAGGTYGTLAGTVNGVNTVFTVSNAAYVSGSLMVFLNGQEQTQGVSNDWTETSPSSGTFTFAVAPPTGSIIQAAYIKTASTSGTGNFPVILATVAGINALSIANTTLYTVPAGKTCTIIEYVVRVTAASGITTGAAAGIGNISGTNNISASQSMNTVTSVFNTFEWPIVGVSSATSTAGIIFFNLGTPAVGTSQTLTVDLIGYTA